ncbi:MAG TPA: ATP-binding protein [Chitinophagales bacterium]|jgi:predicted AAA+ superfamily ATPase|nr:ATP-binding protein [Chitinophagales bacterium]MBP6153598.1 ATP-binding protein [Chitinophagales bacterium]HQV77902.1 ATP-binding protein [Chitinophagales bacterium]HQW78623.1 ATP-binding protein [Chitinophagales bacterium]HQW78624.1 ATP-binding protein [Chitinophagales bacterium]
MIVRTQLRYAQDRLFKGKALLVFGPRQAGKSTFVAQLLAQNKKKKVLQLNGDDDDTRELLTKPNSTKLKNIIGNNEILFIDEAQRIQDIGIVIKIIIDQLKTVQVIATGSSAFELANKTNEPLTGRKYEMHLFPFSFSELVNEFGFIEEKRQLEKRLIYGTYPEIVVNAHDAEEHLKLLANSYLYKDLFRLEQVSKPALLEKIVKALALQIGSEVNYNELSQLVQADNKTIEKYIDLLEKAFVVFRLPALNKNVRNEIKKGKKIYFYDNGIINAVSGNFSPIHKRTDVGQLWENYVISERRKYLFQHQLTYESYFWRTTQQQEIDYIELQKNNYLAVEIKWNPKTKVKFSTTFLDAYKHKELVVTPGNMEDLLI